MTKDGDKTRELTKIMVSISYEHVNRGVNVRRSSASAENKKGQLSLTNPRDACETFARLIYTTLFTNNGREQKEAIAIAK